ncbi:MAG: S8 family serine peptidase, partial [Actinomycetota bacterium]|nr:S8 family serine peptidase [Actinomycetota bacterium]
MRGRLGRLAIAATAALLLAAAPSLAERPGFPGAEPGGASPRSQESPRANTPDDPDFDACEADDQDPGGRACTSYFSEQYGLFGFAPDSSDAVYADCSQLDAQGRDANLKAGNLPCEQISGVRADSAWKFGDRAGDPNVAVAILDTGIRWEDPELVDKVRLNRGELRRPAGGRPQPVAPFNDPPSKDGDQRCEAFTGAGFDRDRDGAVSVGDYACDSRVSPAAGDDEADAILDASDLIARFSDRRDDDGNGYRDDVAGWDFFDDDNDPFDVSSCCSATDHGTGRATEAAADTNNAAAGASLCPDCQIIPMRVWDTFVVDTNLFALGTAYAADNGAEVVEGAVGGLLNSSFARGAFRYADRKGVTLTLVSSDLNTANHNYPTNYNEAIYVGGTLPDTAPNETCEGPGLPGVSAPEPPSGGGGFTAGCNAFLAALGRASGGTVPPPSTQPQTTSFFRNSNLTQYGGKADIVLVGATGSENTGQASGAAGLLESYARDRFTGRRRELSNNEVRQLLTMSAEDVRPANTGQIGLPDKASPGWDPHSGYGRVNLAGAMRMIQAGRIPPEAQLDGPDWFAPINVDRVGSGGVPVRGRIAAPHSDAGPGRWSVQFACGQDAPDSAFRPTGISGSGSRSGRLGTLSRGLLSRLADTCQGEVRNDAGRPAGRASDGAWPADPYPNPDPERKAFQIRLVVPERGDAANRGIYRKTLFAYRDDGNLRGFPKPVGSGSEASALITGSGG